MAKDPLGYEVLTYVWIIALSCLGGVASYIGKVRSGVSRANITEFVGDLFISGFSGLMTFYLCQAADISPQITAVFVGISGHMGSRTIFAIEKRLTSWLEVK